MKVYIWGLGESLGDLAEMMTQVIVTNTDILTPPTVAQGKKETPQRGRLQKERAS